MSSSLPSAPTPSRKPSSRRRGLSERWAVVALCLAMPAAFYAFGDATEAFPGVLTLRPQSEEPEQGPPAQAEDWEFTAGQIPQASPAPSLDPELGADLQQRMQSHADAPVVAGNLAFSVIDAETGETIADLDAHTARTPASTLKLLTAAAALHHYDLTETLPTRAVIDGSTVTVQGTGNMLLTNADIAQLAEQTAQILRNDSTDSVTVALDDSLLPGGENPAWGGNGRAGGWVAPTSAMAINAGRLDDTMYGPKSADPVGDLGRAFIEQLREHDITVNGEATRAVAPTGGTVTEVSSPTIGEIVEHTLLTSDNTTAELLGHLVAQAEGETPTPESAARAVASTVRSISTELGVPEADVQALRILDCSGLSRENLVPPALLSVILADLASGDAPDLEAILYAVPIAGLTGTLGNRFGSDEARDARGTVRGKTGYLGGTSSLAGVSVLPNGRTVTFAIVVHGFDGADADAARAAVDAVAAELTRTP